MPRGVRKSITLPGLLAPAVKQRCTEFGHSTLTPYAVELVCYDLRSDAKHEITVAVACDTQAAQDAVDRELVSRYQPGQKREGLLVQIVERLHHLQDVAARGRHDLPVQLDRIRPTRPTRARTGSFGDRGGIRQAALRSWFLTKINENFSEEDAKSNYWFCPIS